MAYVKLPAILSFSKNFITVLLLLATVGVWRFFFCYHKNIQYTCTFFKLELKVAYSLMQIIDYG